MRGVEELECTLASGDLLRAREEIRNQVGVITVEADEREIRLLGERGTRGSGGVILSWKSLKTKEVRIR